MGKQDKHFFKHDLGARNDEKIKKIRCKHGMAGYGVYMSLLEMLYESSDCCLEYDLDLLIFDLRASKKLIRTIVEDFGLFIIEGGYFYSIEACRRLNKAIEKSAKAKQSVNSRWETDTKPIRNEYENDTKPIRSVNKIRQDKMEEKDENLCEQEDVGISEGEVGTQDISFVYPNSVQIDTKDEVLNTNLDTKGEKTNTKDSVLNVETGETKEVLRGKNIKKNQYNSDKNNCLTNDFDSWFLKMITDTPNKSNVYDVYDIWKHKLSELDRERCLKVVDIYTSKYITNRFNAVSYLEHQKFNEDGLHDARNKSSPNRQDTSSRYFATYNSNGEEVA